MEGKRFWIIYQNDTNIPGAQSPDGGPRRYNLAESTSLSLEHNPGIHKEAESQVVSPRENEKRELRANCQGWTGSPSRCLLLVFQYFTEGND